MARRLALPFGLLAAICGAPHPVLCSGQFPVVPERCAGTSHHRKAIITWRKAFIARVDFDGPIHLSQSVVAQIIKEANHGRMNADDPEWVKGFAEVGLREMWLNHGFYKVNVTAEAHSLGGNSSIERFLVTAHVNEGLQYWLSGVRFVGATDVPEAKLREAVPIRDGEPFDVSRIKEGIQSLTKLYDSLGYIDFTTAPFVDVDDDRISVVFHLDLQKQYRVGKVEIRTVDSRLEIRLREFVRPGEVYDSGAVEDFLKKNKSALPPGFSPTDDIYLVRNMKAGIVDLGFDFRRCR